jgi:predicted dehydrogenase
MKLLRIGILGCGRIATGTHLPLLSAMPGVKLTALAEPDASLRQQALAIAPGATATADWRDVIARDDVDAVVVCLPSALHAEAGAAALNARKHLYLEKPIACDLSGAALVLEAWKKSGCIAMTGFNYRFHPLAIELRRQIQSGRIGRVIAIQSVFSTRAGDLPGWKARRSSGGGVLLDLASHHVDLYRFLLQREIASVFARVTSLESEADTATLDLSDTGGVSIHSFFSLRSLEQNRIEVFGADGKVSLDLYRSTQLDFTAARGGGILGQLAEIPGDLWRRGNKLMASKLNPRASQFTWRAALAEFVVAASELRAPSCDLNDGLASLKVIDAAERAAGLKALVEVVPEVIAPASPDTTSFQDAGLEASAVSPAMSVILATPSPAGTIAATLNALRAQTIRGRLELVIVVESKDNLGLNPRAVAGFHDVRIVEVGVMRSIAHADAEGVRAASAPIIAFAEDHAFPELTWAEELLAAHRGPWAAVGPLILNANPDTAVSCADLLLGYGPWLDPGLCGERSHLPGHNSSYKRAALLEYGDNLEEMLKGETLLQWDMRSKGLRLWQSREARTRHTNFSLVAPFAEASFCNGRAFAAARAMPWSMGRRAIFAMASPLIPAVRFFKIIRDAKGLPAVRDILRRALPALALGLFLDGLGQMLGYASGPGDSAGRLKKVEFNRAQNITPKDREALFGAPHAFVPLEAT